MCVSKQCGSAGGVLEARIEHSLATVARRRMLGNTSNFRIMLIITVITDCLKMYSFRAVSEGVDQVCVLVERSLYPKICHDRVAGKSSNNICQ